jgi:LPS-assembly protein
LGFYLKNLNTTGKNDEIYKSSAQVELMNIVNYEASLPLAKTNEKYFNTITPKISLRTNPSDMKNYSSSDREINTSNIFSIDRLGLDDSFEEGESLTLGLDYRKETLKNINKFFEFNLATILREKEENRIPTTSTINQKSSNLFGSSEFNMSENLKINYDFAIDNDLNTFEYNSIGSSISLNNLVTTFDFMEKNGKMGSTNFIENKTSYNFNNSNYISFNTRRNRKINLTEYYDLVYEYKNDCLTAGIKYKKTYYEDREVKPSEDLFFTVTLFPLTQYEQKVDQTFYRD